MQQGSMHFELCSVGSLYLGHQNYIERRHTPQYLGDLTPDALDFVDRWRPNRYYVKLEATVVQLHHLKIPYPRRSDE